MQSNDISAHIKHYHVSQLARRIRGKYLDTKSKNLAKRLTEIENRKYDSEIEKLMKMDKKGITELYKNRKIERKATWTHSKGVDNNIFGRN